MKFFDLRTNLDQFYTNTYNLNYWLDTNRSAPMGIRLHDAWPAMCYAYGIYHVPVIYTIREQLDFLQQSKTRLPGTVLEIGSGRGEVSCALAMMGQEVFSTDVNSDVHHLTRATSRDLFGKITPDTHSLFLGDLTCLPHNVIETANTVMLIESIEHIFPSEWWNFFERIVPSLKQTQGQLIITNEPEYWPLGFSGDCREHINLVDDNFYDKLAQHASSTVLRKTSHLVLQF